jgi:uncharacterized protein GlcG (DUF336 family)
MVTLVAVIVGLGTATLNAAPASAGCPVAWQTLRLLLPKAVADAPDTPDNFGNNMWGVVVDRNGIVCAVAFSGQQRDDQWLLSRQIAAAKAWTANGLSLDGAPLTTADLDQFVQPGVPDQTPAPLYGVAAGNPLDHDAAYKGPVQLWGTRNDPMVGEIVGGTITFGGGVPLLGPGGTIVGGLGISGDTAAQDDSVAVTLRGLLNLD